MSEDTKYKDFYRHTDGGIYLFKKFVWLASDGSRAIEYEHVWPFEEKTWIRVESEWAGRFTPISSGEANAALGGDRAQAQAAITAAKKARRALEQKVTHDKWRASWRWHLPSGIQVMPGAFTEQFVEADPEKVKGRVEAGDLYLFAGCVAFDYIEFVDKPGKGS